MTTEIVDLPIENGKFTIVMLVYQRVLVLGIPGIPLGWFLYLGGPPAPACAQRQDLQEVKGRAVVASTRMGWDDWWIDDVWII